jgi:hypothetical protein
VPQIDVDDDTYGALRIAANAAGVSVGEVVARALAALGRETPPPTPTDPWAEVPIYAEYLGARVEAKLLPATRRVLITSGSLAGKEFATPSAAAGAVVAERNPHVNPRSNGWRFWHVAETGDYIDTVRSPRPSPPRP